MAASWDNSNFSGGWTGVSSFLFRISPMVGRNHSGVAAIDCIHKESIWSNYLSYLRYLVSRLSIWTYRYMFYLNIYSPEFLTGEFWQVGSRTSANILCNMAFDDVLCEGRCSPVNLLAMSSWIGGKPAIGFVILGGILRVSTTASRFSDTVIINLVGLGAANLILESSPESLLVSKLVLAQLGYDKFATFFSTNNTTLKVILPSWP